MNVITPQNSITLHEFNSTGRMLHLITLHELNPYMRTQILYMNTIILHEHNHSTQI